jgi:hypothetical protein
MTSTQLREWLFQNSQVDEWWLSLDAVTEDCVVTINEIEERLKSGMYGQAQVLHVSQTESPNSPWTEVFLSEPIPQPPRIPNSAVAPLPSPRLGATKHRAEKPKKSPLFLGFMLGGLGGFLGLSLLCVIASNKSATGRSTKGTTIESSPPRINGEDGYYASRRYIQNCLKAPSTAKFSNIQTDANTGWKSEDGDRIRCWGTVDAQNSYGVPLREVWMTVVQPSGSKWDIVYATHGNETLIDIRDQRKTTKILLAEEFLGKTKEQMISILGEPKNVEHSNSASDGGFSIYKYSDQKGKETFFIIWDSDQRIDNGMYEGTYF